MNRVTGFYTAEFEDTAACNKICTFLKGISSIAHTEITDKLPSTEFKSLEQSDYQTPVAVKTVKEYFNMEYLINELTDQEAYILINFGVLKDEKEPNKVTCMVADEELDTLKIVSKYLKLAGCKKAKLVEINEGFNEIKF